MSPPLPLLGLALPLLGPALAVLGPALVLAGSEYQLRVAAGRSLPAWNYRLQSPPSAAWILPLEPLDIFTGGSECECNDCGIVTALKILSSEKIIFESSSLCSHTILADNTLLLSLQFLIRKKTYL